MLKSILTTTAILLITLSISVNAQLCGDINGDNALGISDLTSFMDYFYSDGFIVAQNADVDGRIGVTISDLNFFVGSHYNKDSHFSCNPTDIYNYNLSDSDTLFLSYYNDIPENKDELFFPVGFTGSINSNSTYFPIITNQANNFQYIAVQSWDDYLSTSIGCLPDTVVIFSIQFFSLTGNQLLASFKYSRINNGIDNFSLEVTDRTDTLKYGVGKFGDMFRPVVVYVDVSYPFGDYNFDKQLTISDLIGMIEYLFWGDIRYDPYENSFGVSSIDNNCDGAFGISDLTYFVNYLFGGGPAPCNPFAF